MKEILFGVIFVAYLVANTYLASNDVNTPYAQFFEPTTNSTTNQTSSESFIPQESEFGINDWMSNLLNNYSVFIPRIYKTDSNVLLLTTKTSDGHVENITLQLDDNVTGKIINIRLKLTPVSWKKGFVINVGGDSNYYPTYEEMKLFHCYYHGEVIGGGDAVFSTCYGLSGQANLNETDVVYVQPLFDVPMEIHSLSFKHMIYREADRKSIITNCDEEIYPESRSRDFIRNIALKDSKLADSDYLKNKNKFRRSDETEKWIWADPYNFTPTTKFVEVYVFNDYNQYQRFGKDIWKVIARTKEVMNMVNSIYRELGIIVVLSGVEVWNDSNPISVGEEVYKTYKQFENYTTRMKVRYDVFMLIIGNITFAMDKPFISGIAPIGPLCNRLLANMVCRDEVDITKPLANCLAHEMGHLFGLHHLTTKECICEERSCVMSGSGNSDDRLQEWSNCSQKFIFKSISEGRYPCLNNLPEADSVLPSCGNGLKEDGEECDCGLTRDCNSKCCVPLECKLAQNAVCANGMCCDLNTCQHKNRGVKCRPSTGCCDLPEYCTGDDGRCPDDAFLQNGAPCQAYGEESICYDGQCQTYNGQCQSLWDYSGKAAEPSCYQNNFYRNCDDRMRKDPDMTCEEKDIRCGLIQCLATPELPRFEKIVGSSKTTGACRTARYTINPRINNGLANDGSKCNLDSICISNQCVKMSSIGFPKSCSCTGTGICNHLGECYYGEDGPIESCKINISSKGSGLILAISLLIFFALAGAFAIILSKIIVKRKELRISRAQQSTQEAAQTET